MTSLLLILNTTKSTLICEKAMVFMYSKNIHSVFFSTWDLFNRNIYISFSILQHTISNILSKVKFHYTAVLWFLYPATNVQSFPPEHVIIQENNSAFSLHHASIVLSLNCEKKIAIMYTKIVYTLYFYQLIKSWTVLFHLPNL